jgi:hypothetical protein
MIVDTINVRGDVTLSLYDEKGGRLKHQVEVRNLVTTAGKNFIVRKIFNDATETVAKISIGSGTTYQYNITTNTTVITGSAANGRTLRYTPGKVSVTKNNNTLDPTAYTATSGSAITLATPAVNGDIIRVFSAVVSVGDTALETELSKATIQFAFIDQVDNNLMHYISTFGENIGTGIVREVGLLSSSNPEKLLCRTALTTPFVKAATDYLVVNWKLQIG